MKSSVLGSKAGMLLVEPSDTTLESSANKSGLSRPSLSALLTLPSQEEDGVGKSEVEGGNSGEKQAWLSLLTQRPSDSL
jgi:hypothetical protein